MPLLVHFRGEILTGDQIENSPYDIKMLAAALSLYGDLTDYNFTN